MVCNKCGYDNAEGISYCVNCGVKIETTNESVEQAPVEPATNVAPIEPTVQQPAVQQQPVGQPQVGSITIIRPDNFVGILVPYSVYVDNYYMGSVGNNSQATFQLYYGSHVVRIDCGMGSGTQQIIINNKNST